MQLAMQGLGVDDKSIFAARQLWVVAPLIVAAPLSYSRQISSLRYTSCVALISILLITVMVFYFALPTKSSVLDPCEDGVDCRGSMRAATDVHSTLKALPLFVFAYTCHQNVISVTNELRDPTPPRFMGVIGSAVGWALAVYIIVAGAGYFTFGDAKNGSRYILQSDILDSYPQHLTIVIIARVLISCVVTMCYMLQAHPSCSCVVTLVCECMRACNRSPPKVMIMRPIITTIFLAASVSIALLTNDLGIMLKLVGATGSTAVSYILPGISYFVLFRGSRKRWLGLVLFLIGMVIAPVSLALIFT